MKGMKKMKKPELLAPAFWNRRLRIKFHETGCPVREAVPFQFQTNPR